MALRCYKDLTRLVGFVIALRFDTNIILAALSMMFRGALVYWVSDTGPFYSLAVMVASVLRSAANIAIGVSAVGSAYTLPACVTAESCALRALISSLLLPL